MSAAQPAVELSQTSSTAEERNATDRAICMVVCASSVLSSHLTIHWFNSPCLDLNTLVTRLPYDPCSAHARLSVDMKRSHLGYPKSSLAPRYGQPYEHEICYRAHGIVLLKLPAHLAINPVPHASGATPSFTLDFLQQDAGGCILELMTCWERNQPPYIVILLFKPFYLVIHQLNIRFFANPKAATFAGNLACPTLSAILLPFLEMSRWPIDSRTFVLFAPRYANNILDLANSTSYGYSNVQPHTET
ncbi:uncharacterized protein BDR25DRAFT_352962 [Lindgomyces ingoldianus]|uniref:Uncharacterized protein n=1 Tax=Lindgomyces ingoldianus TaxID=673940 RepID=A0ACB6R023_9PLEO|nr:uncharacterized protein BDR25DRAFT_352962 [Lindgomyces ingoldianus]KAF2472654.1 hypothetical protein BDR25DRAFT_352962 [Lindgomyces ingoldianus]